MNESHFDKIYWFIVGLVGFGALYTIAVTFIPIPKGSERFADTGHVFWLSTAVAGGIGYLIGNSAQKSRTQVTQEAQNINNNTTSAAPDTSQQS